MSARARSAQTTAPDCSKSTTASSSARRASPRRRRRRRAVASAISVRARSYGLGARSCSSSERPNSASACSCSPRSEAIEPAVAARPAPERARGARASIGCFVLCDPCGGVRPRRPSAISASIPLGGCLQTGSIKPAASLRRSESLEVLQRRGRRRRGRARPGRARDRPTPAMVRAPARGRAPARRAQALSASSSSPRSAQHRGASQAGRTSDSSVSSCCSPSSAGSAAYSRASRRFPASVSTSASNAERRRPLPLVASLDGVVQHLEAELPRAVVLTDSAAGRWPACRLGPPSLVIDDLPTRRSTSTDRSSSSRPSGPAAR